MRDWFKSGLGAFLTHDELARLVETSEASAYRALAECGRSENAEFVAKEVGGAVAIVAPSVTTSLNLNRVIGLGIGEAATTAHLDEIEALYGSRGLSFGIEIGPYVRPPQLVGWLRARRIRRGVETAMLYRRLDKLHQRPTDVQVREATLADVPMVVDICCDGFRMPRACEPMFVGAIASPRWRQWLAFVDGAPAGAALSFIGDVAAWLGWDATVPSFRGRGVQGALIARRMRDAAERGCEFATAETALGTPERRDPSRGNYEKIGFQFAYRRHTYVSLNRNTAARV